MQVEDADAATISGHGTFKVLVAPSRLGPAGVNTSRSALQAATRIIHARMHHHPGLARLAAGTIGRDEYRRLLARSYGFYAVVQPAIGLPEQLTDSLVRDLGELGMTVTAVSNLPRCAPPGIGCRHADIIGARYVLLGASLGGKVMAKAIVNRKDGDTTMPVRFLTFLGESDWKSFAADLEASLPDAASRTQAAKTATTVFAAYEEWMAGHA